MFSESVEGFSLSIQGIKAFLFEKSSPTTLPSGGEKGWRHFTLRQLKQWHNGVPFNSSLGKHDRLRLGEGGRLLLAAKSA